PQSLATGASCFATTSILACGTRERTCSGPVRSSCVTFGKRRKPMFMILLRRAQPGFATFLQPGSALSTRLRTGGFAASLWAGLIGRRTISPAQLGQRPPAKRVSTQAAQNVHSNEQIIASVDPGGRSLSQHSQFGLNSRVIAVSVS